MNTSFIPRTLAILFMFHLSTVLAGQVVKANFTLQHIFTATRNGKEIGWLRTTSVDNGNERFLMIESNLVVQMLLSFEAKAIAINKFTGITLLQAGVHRTLNGKVKLDNALQLTDGKYSIVKGEAEELVPKPILNTVVSIYFKEPVGITEIYSEVYLRFIEVKKIAPSVYQTMLPDGGSVTYTYTRGILTEIIAKTSYGTVQFELTK